MPRFKLLDDSNHNPNRSEEITAIIASKRLAFRKRLGYWQLVDGREQAMSKLKLSDMQRYRKFRFSHSN